MKLRRFPMKIKMMPVFLFLSILLGLISYGNLFGQPVEQEAQGELFVFVGEKIEVIELGPVGDTKYTLDYAFKAKYRVLENIYGDLEKDVIEFTAYDHDGILEFSFFDHVLLYIVKENSEYFHCRNLFSPLFKTRDGRWAAPYDYYEYKPPYNKGSKIKPEKIEFSSIVELDMTNIPKKFRNAYFPKPYYKRIGSKAIAIYGNYIPELFQLKKDNILKEEGLVK
jgi:hypothetical protein